MEWHRCELDISASVPPSTHQNVPRCRCGCCTDCCTSATDGMQFVVLSWDKASRQEQHRPWGATVLRPRSTAAIVDGLSWPRLQALPVTGSRRASADGAGRLDYDTDKTKNTPDDQYINANKTGDQFVLGGACQSAACSGTATFTYDPRPAHALEDGLDGSMCYRLADGLGNNERGDSELRPDPHEELLP